MILYKYRSLQNIEFCFDIILNERLYCAFYNELNDPFEGLFYETFTPSGRHSILKGLAAIGTKFSKCKSIEDLDGGFEEARICSLSTSINDIRLWSYYADGNKGIAIEIDFSEYEKDANVVYYEPKLREFGSTLLTRATISRVLSYKTKHWDYENEYRIIQKDRYYPIPGRIKKVFTGHRISKLHLELLNKIIPKGIPIIPTKIDTKELSIVPCD